MAEEDDFHEEPFARLDAATIRGLPKEDCPDRQLLLRYTDRSLPADARETVRAHLLQCPACACIAADLQQISAPVVRLHRMRLLPLAWLHFRQQGRLGPKLEEAWTLHQSQCASCRQKAARLQRLGVRDSAQDEDDSPRRETILRRKRLLGTLTPALSFGLGLMVMFWFSRSHVSTLLGDPLRNNGSDLERGTPALPDLSAEGNLQSMLSPTPGNPSRQQSQIQAWQALPAELEMEKQACLGGFYYRSAVGEKDPKQQQLWLSSSRASLLRARAEIDRRLKILESGATGQGRKEGNRKRGNE